MRGCDLIRVFIGFDFDDTMKEEIKKTSSLIKNHLISGKITDQDNIHLTIKFLGDICDDKYEDVVCAVDEVIDKIHKFNISLDKLGYFDKKSKYRVLWLGINGDMDCISKYFSILDSSLCDYGFDKDFREYTPHITIGRNIKLTMELDELNLLLPINHNHSCVINKLYIYESTSENGIRVYKKIKEYSLA